MANLSYYKDYVHHVFALGDIDGCGIFAEKFFITAGHVAENDIWVYHGGRKISFSKDECIFLGCSPKCVEDFEIAVFPSKGIESPIKLGGEVEIGDELDSYSFKHKGGEDESFLPVFCKGKVSTVMGNFFICSMSEELTEGSSGSPVFRGEEVIGILVGCPGEDKAEILFNSISSVISRIKK